jgi:DNA-binding NarL/FixJ family response regulator
MLVSSAVRVVIVDDHALVREGTREILDRADGIEVVGEAATGEEILETAAVVRPDVALVDVAMPGMNGIETTRLLKKQQPDLCVLALTVHDDEAYVLAILEAGAAGYLLKDVHGDELVDAILAVCAGESVLHPGVVGTVLRSLRDQTPQGRPEATLTERETDVLRAAANGSSNKTIADQLNVSPRTIQVHLRRVFRKLGVASRTEAVVNALQRGILRLEELE